MEEPRVLSTRDYEFELTLDELSAALDRRFPEAMRDAYGGEWETIACQTYDPHEILLRGGWTGAMIPTLVVMERTWQDIFAADLGPSLLACVRKVIRACRQYNRFGVVPTPFRDEALAAARRIAFAFDEDV